MGPKLELFLYSLACGACLAAFTLIPDLFRYIFSLVTFFLGLRFFGKHETWGMRIGLMVLAVLFFFIFITAYTILAIINGWYLPALPQTPQP